MNENPDLGSYWKGRILMQIAAEKTEKPLCICQKLTEEVKELANPYLAEKEYEIIAEIGQGVCLPGNEKYSIMIRMAEFEMKSPAAVF